MAQDKKVYSFKSVGQTVKQAEDADVFTTAGTPIGILTPVRPAKKIGTLFEMSSNLTKQIKDNFKNMLSTNHGERLMLSDYGANLKPLAYEIGTESGDTAAITRINATTSKYMPFITLETFEPIREVSTDGSLSRVGVRITYSVPSLGITSQVIDALILTAG